ncbi:MAG: imelysin family protein [Sulfitobacter sp.]
MKRFALIVALTVAPLAAMAQGPLNLIEDIVGVHILPRFETLADRTEVLAEVAGAECSPTSASLRAAYGDAFDAWVSASHLRFGPTETDDRAFALAFWPDSRGATPRALRALLSDQDPIANSAEAYRQVSIAARGFYAMELLLFEEDLMRAGRAHYHCQLIQTMAADIASTSQQIFDHWRLEYAEKMQDPQPAGTYRSVEEGLQELFKSLSTGLQFTGETRLGRPLGSYDRPRPKRAEAHRSARSARHVMLSLVALQDLSARLTVQDKVLAAKIYARFEQALTRLSDLDDPTFAGVGKPQTRFQVEIVQQSIEAIRTVVRAELGPTLGVAAGFNALDGD